MSRDTQGKQEEDTISLQMDLLREGLPQYGLAACAIFNLQSVVFRKLKAVLDNQLGRMKILWGLKSGPTDSMPDVSPKLGETRDHQSADISAKTWIGTPIDAMLWLSFSCSFSLDEKSEMELTVALETSRQFRRREIATKLRNSPGYFDTIWRNYAVGLRRQLRSVDDMEDKASKLLEEFLAAFQAEGAQREI